MSADREAAVTAAFVSLANGMAEGVGVVELLGGLATDCARLLDVDSAGLLLADRRGVLHVVAASSERTRDLELFQLQRDEGPCRDCFHDGSAVSVADLSDHTDRWPSFVDAATEAGFASVHALPMRLKDNVLGALGLFGTAVGALNEEDLALGQALAHVASVALVSERASSDQALVNEQLQSALTSRVQLEQAKGLLAQLGDLQMEQAFAVLRRYARDHNLRLSDLAARVVTRQVGPQEVLEHARAKGELGASAR